MRSTPTAAGRAAARPFLLGIVALGLAMVGLALLAVAMARDGGTVYLANLAAGRERRASQPSIEVVGIGEARAPAERALLQLLIVREAPYGAHTTPKPGAGSPTPATNHEPEAPIVAAIRAAGEGGKTIRVIVSPALISVCDTLARCSSVRIDVTVEEPTLLGLNAIIDAAGATAAAEGVTLIDVGAGYVIADCAALNRTARELATADARRRAVEQAAALRVDLGDLLIASEPDSDAGRDARGCPTAEPGLGDSWWTAGSIGLTVPGFDPTAPPETVATAHVSLVYAIAGRAEATPPA